MKTCSMKVYPVKAILFSLILGFSITLLSGEFFYPNIQEKVDVMNPIKPGQYLQIVVPADQNWTDTGRDVFEGQELVFQAAGGISLQKGNPIAYCNPEGYPLKTVQQPLKDENLGALIGKVVKIISVEIDEETGEEKINKIEQIFYIGKGKRMTIPLSGRLYLGINELIVGDNVGTFKVEIKAE